MRYREFQSAPPLSKHVECLWLLESSDRRKSTAPERILPDGCFELILNFGAPFRKHKEAGRSKLQPSRFVVGQMTQPVACTECRFKLVVALRLLCSPVDDEAEKALAPLLTLGLEAARKSRSMVRRLSLLNCNEPIL
ncbi:MAG: DUF6597 domain-containing transcriptional factor [Blastocatellia bacterium]